MKPIKRILAENPNIPLIQQLYGQNLDNILQQISTSQDKKIYLISQKQLGLKRILKFFKSNQIEFKIIGKKSPDLRLIELNPQTVNLEITEQSVTLKVGETAKTLKTSNSIFSKNQIDPGSQKCLEYLEDKKLPITGQVLEVGSGYGAISYYLLSKYQEIFLDTYEIDQASVVNCEDNLKGFQNKKIHLKNFFNTKLFKKFDYLIANPPLHISSDERKQMFSKIHANNANLKMVLIIKSRFAQRFLDSCQKYYPSAKLIKIDNYFILTNLEA